MSRKGNDMKTNGSIHLRFIHSSSASFTLPILRKPLQPALLPFSHKKFPFKEAKCECERAFQR